MAELSDSSGIYLGVLCPYLARGEIHLPLGHSYGFFFLCFIKGQSRADDSKACQGQESEISKRHSLVKRLLLIPNTRPAQQVDIPQLQTAIAMCKSASFIVALLP